MAEDKSKKNSEARFVIYSDESGWSKGNFVDTQKSEYGSLAAITIDTEKISVEDLQEDHNDLLQEVRDKQKNDPKLTEMKFKDGSPENLEVIKKVFDLFERKDTSTEEYENSGITMDIITWKKDDITWPASVENVDGNTLALMYRLLLMEVIYTRTKKETLALKGDRADQLKGLWKEAVSDRITDYILNTLKISDKDAAVKKFKKVQEKIILPSEDSKRHLFIQVADIMAASMRRDFEKSGKAPNTKQKKKDDIMQAVIERLHALRFIEEAKPGILLHTPRLHTPRPRNKAKRFPINFWLFQPAKKKKPNEKPEEPVPSIIMKRRAS